MDGDANSDQLYEIYHTGLRNMHALEMTAIELTERQVERLDNYPEMAARLQQHRRESVAAALHMPAPDEILKNTFANFAFEHQEMAAYTSLIAMAEKLGDTASVAPLKQSLGEEQAMADWIGAQIVPTTDRFMELTRAGAKAGV